jgi:hypothetical protein
LKIAAKTLLRHVPILFVFVFVYLPTDLSLTDNFHKFQLKIRLQTSRKQKTKAVNHDKKKKILLKRDENKSMKRKICDPCHEKKSSEKCTV